MTTVPYSQDLRKKVILYLELGKSQRSAAKVFDLNLSTVNSWWRRFKNEGNYVPRKRLGKKSRVNLEALKNYIELNHKLKIHDVGKHFGISKSGAAYWLKKLGYKLKKKPHI